MNHISNTMRQKDNRPAPAEIEYKGLKFLITDRPSDQTIMLYIQVSPKHYTTTMRQVSFRSQRSFSKVAWP